MTIEEYKRIRDDRVDRYLMILAALESARVKDARRVLDGYEESLQRRADAYMQLTPDQREELRREWVAEADKLSAAAASLVAGCRE